MSGAFHADATVKAAAVARLAARIQAGTLSNEVALYQPGSASWSGELAQSSELMDLPVTAGIPAGLGLAVDHVLKLLAPQPQAREAAAHSLLAAIRPGAQLAAVAAGLVPALLDDPRLAQWKQLPLLAELCALHRRCAADEAVPRSDWMSLRKRVSTAMHAEVDNSPSRLMLQVIEAAAWPMAESRAGLAEVIWMYQRLTGALEARALGWMPEDDAQVQHAMKAIAQAHAGEGEKGQPIEFMGELAKREPLLAERMTQMHEAIAQNQIGVGHRVAELLARAFAAA